MSTPAGPRVIDSLRESWLRRGAAAADELAAAVTAPGLFTPERVEQVQAEYDRAVAEVARWAAQP